jgi:hypothetical protein
MVVDLLVPFRDMKIEGDGALLMGLASSFLAFLGVGGCGAALPDSSSDGSPATWDPVMECGSLVFFSV